MSGRCVRWARGSEKKFVPVSPPLWLVIESDDTCVCCEGPVARALPLVGTAKLPDGRRVPCVIDDGAVSPVDLPPGGHTVHVLPSYELAAKLTEEITEGRD